MIYGDPDDTVYVPANRNQDCLNCGQEWKNHDGWSCSHTSTFVAFDALDPSDRYLTCSMLDALAEETMRSFRKDLPTEPCMEIAAAKAVAEPATKDLTDWRVWAHDAPGDCPCGIRREVCCYHS